MYQGTEQEFRWISELSLVISMYIVYTWNRLSLV